MAKILGVHSNPVQGFQDFVNQSDRMIATSNTGSPSAGVFHSAVTNRSSMPDMSKDLKPRIGIERINFAEIVHVRNEFGPNGEVVYGMENDPFNQVRFIGKWASGTLALSGAARGTNISPNANNTSFEITFYGTGLNMLGTYNGGPDTVTVFVDGISQGSQSLPNSGISNVNVFSTNRGYPSNQPLNVIRGLSPGVHTVRIFITSSTVYYCGYEILNESTNVLTPPGSSIVSGQKISSTVLSTLAHNSVVTGTKGGRVLVYQASNGSIGQAWTATNASSLTGTSADHSNEDVARIYNWREFGGGRSDDFGTLQQNTTRDAAWTMNDGTTTLWAVNALTNQIGGNVGYSMLRTSGSARVIDFTFVGTGLDFLRIDNSTGGGANDQVTCSIDGGSAFNLVLAGQTVPHIEKIASGLPYGTHTVKLLSTTPTAYDLGIIDLIVYQPKKPALPAGAIELADYNVMAPFVHDTISPPTLFSISQGVLRKMASREASYQGSWNFDTSSGSYVGYFGAATTTNGDFVEYTFYGTGIVMREIGNAATIQITIDGATNFAAANSSPSGGAGWSASPLPTTAVTGTGASFSASSGILTLGANVFVSLAISGLTLGLHRIRMSKTGGTSWQHTAFDVITPTHAVVNGGPGNEQNELGEGSCSIKDSRLVNPLGLTGQGKAWGQAVGMTSGPSGSNTVFVPVPDMSVTVETFSDRSILDCQFFSYCQNGSSNLEFCFYVNSQQYSTSMAVNASLNGTAAHGALVPVTKGVHKIDVYYRCSSGSVGFQGTFRTLKVKEIL